MDYQKQATDFLEETETTMKTVYVDYAPYFDSDDKARDIWRITLRRHGKSYSFKFGQSIADVGETPTAYDVLACLTKYDPGTLDYFGAEFGWDKNTVKTYKAVVKEFAGINRLFADVIDKLAEIQ